VVKELRGEQIDAATDERADERAGLLNKMRHLHAFTHSHMISD